jgi:hypothetical protein
VSAPLPQGEQHGVWSQAVAVTRVAFEGHSVSLPSLPCPVIVPACTTILLLSSYLSLAPTCLHTHEKLGK